MALGLVLLLGAAGASPAVAAPATSEGWSAALAATAAWVKSLQYTDPDHPRSLGAFRIHHDPGAFVPPATYYHHVVPYDANKAVSGFLRSGDEDRLKVAERWIDWYFNHTHQNPPGLRNPVAPDGVVFDHWYRSDGSGESTCVPALGLGGCHYRDADDSNAATFLTVLWIYRDEGGARAATFLNATGRKAAIEAVAGGLLALMDGQDLTFARPDWRYRYLMDNSEVYCGLRALASIEAQNYGDAQRAGFYASWADRVRDAIQYRLFDAATGAYRIQIDPAGLHYDRDLRDWYPGSVATVWPALHGVTAGDDAVARRQVEDISLAWDGVAQPNWTREYTNTDPSEANLTWPAMGHAALLAGDRMRAENHTDFVGSEKVDQGFPARVSGGEAGWLMLTLSARLQPPERNLVCP